MCLILAYFQKKYIFKHYALEINITSIFIISLCSISITIIVSIFPALKAAKLDPIQALNMNNLIELSI